jgi:hypothetical protein
MQTHLLVPFGILRLLGLLAIALLGNTSEAQFVFPPPPPQANQSPPKGEIDYAVTQVGPDSVVWRNSAGQSVTSIATGMNYWDGQQWNSSDPSFAVSADGMSFVAIKLQAPTTLAQNLNTQGAVSVSTPDGVPLSSTPIAIGLYDAASGKSVIVAGVTNSTGVLIDPQHVVYPNAFVGGGFAASVVYSLPDTGSFHQDVVFTGFNPNFDPTVWGFAPIATNTLQIQIFTEFYNPPQPTVRERALYIEQDPNVRASMDSPDFIDKFLDFGHYVFGPGRAYPNSAYSLFTPGISVAKDFVTSNGRTFLVESIRYRDLAPQLQSLPPVTIKTSSLKGLPGAKKMRVAAASVPRLEPGKPPGSEKIIPTKVAAMAEGKPHGVSIDYVVTVSSLNEPTIYTSDTTYFVSGDVYITGPATIESAVFKYPRYYAPT